MRFFHIAVATMFGLLMPAAFGSAIAATRAEGFEAYQKGDYETALKIFRPLAEGGDAAAQLNLGVMYWKGNGVAIDYDEARKWFRLAAPKNSGALSDLGQMYFKGEGVSQDNQRAYMWHSLAVDRAESKDLRGYYVEDLSAVSAKMTSAQIKQARALAKRCQASHFKTCG